MKTNLAPLIEHIFTTILRLRPLRVDVYPTTIKVQLPEGRGSVLSALNLSNLLVSYGLPITADELEDDTATFYLAPDRPMDNGGLKLSLASRWSGGAAADGFQIEAEADLTELFKQTYAMEIHCEWEFWDDVLDLTVHKLHRILNAYSQGMNHSLSFFDPQMGERDKEFLTAIWDVLYHPIRIRGSQGLTRGTNRILINPEPLSFSIRSRDEEGAFETCYQYRNGEIEQVGRDSSYDADSLKELMAKWNSTIWAHFWDTVV